MRELKLPEGGLRGHPAGLGRGWAGNGKRSGFSAPASTCVADVNRWADSVLSPGLSFPTRAAPAGR